MSCSIRRPVPVARTLRRPGHQVPGWRVGHVSHALVSCKILRPGTLTPQPLRRKYVNFVKFVPWKGRTCRSPDLCCTYELAFRVPSISHSDQASLGEWQVQERRTGCKRSAQTDLLHKQ